MSRIPIHELRRMGVSQEDIEAAQVTQAAQRRMLTISCAVYTVLCAVLWAIVGGWLAIPCLLAAILCAWYYRHMSYKQFGGITGDLAGWFLQITELTLTAVIVIGGKLL